jgi:hypothetical protein
MASPRRRPPLAVRVVAALFGVAAMLFAGLLMLSDRAPGAMERIGGGVVRRLFERMDVDPDAAGALADPSQGDAVVHVGVWAVAVLLIGWALWTWIGLLIGAIAVTACSFVFEALQGTLTTTRAVESSDVEANLLGVATGTVTAAACYVIYGGLRNAVDSSPARHR